MNIFFVSLGKIVAKRLRLQVVLGALAGALGTLVGGWVYGESPPAALGPGSIGVLAAPGSGYVGSAACAGCHATKAAAWSKSHHALAMTLATPETVLGDFGGVAIESHGSKGRFFRDGDHFMVETEGRDGKTARFAVSHAFGVEPLQQYLVTFPDGRLQALPWAWDSRPREAGGQRWFHLYPNEPIPSSDPLHWTRYMQNWNSMCAECHSTEVRKNYDAARDSFRTSFTEISVGCESCHGPGGAHLAWANGGRDPLVTNKGFGATYARRPTPIWVPDSVTGSPTQAAARPAGDEVELCAHCHARRSQISEGWRPGQPLADTHLPVFLTHDLFEDDGQMKDEVFNDHSFKQSLMYAKGVVCSDCHDPHSGKLKAISAEVCSQCHQTEHFATSRHTGHLSGARSPDCISCHMPTRTYMVVDARHDHSFRIPRPDLSAKLGTPNACNDCHKDKKTAAWAAEAIEGLHGPIRKGHQTWAEAFHRAQADEPAARDLLLKLVNEPATPAVARATAIFEGQRFPSIAMDQATQRALDDPDPLVRVAALRGQMSQPLDIRWRRASPLLSDPSRSVRVEAATLLADQNPEPLSPADRARLEAAWAEYEASQRLNADRPEGRANLGGFLLRRGRPKEAEAEYLAGLKLDPSATPLYVNLADLYRLQGDEASAEQLLRRAISTTPDAAALRHGLGLSLVRQKRYQEAIEQFGRAADLAPEQPRYAYVYIVALQSAGQSGESRAALDRALRRYPFDPELLQLELEDALKQKDLKRAAPIARKLAELAPDDPEIAGLVSWLETHQ